MHDADHALSAVYLIRCIDIMDREVMILKLLSDYLDCILSSCVVPIRDPLGEMGLFIVSEYYFTMLYSVTNKLILNLKWSSLQMETNPVSFIHCVCCIILVPSLQLLCMVLHLVWFMS